MHSMLTSVNKQNHIMLFCVLSTTRKMQTV